MTSFFYTSFGCVCLTWVRRHTNFVLPQVNVVRKQGAKSLKFAPLKARLYTIQPDNLVHKRKIIG